jgi:hypothetical protein
MDLSRNFLTLISPELGGVLHPVNDVIHVVRPALHGFSHLPRGWAALIALARFVRKHPVSAAVAAVTLPG